MKVMVQLDDAMANVLRHSAGASTGRTDASSSVGKLQSLLDRFGVTLEPVHPDPTHPMLAPFFAIRAPDRKTADALIDELRTVAGVTAAYLQPEAQPP
jgi:hypothetical protein